LATALIAALVTGALLWPSRTVTAEEVLAEALRAWQRLDHLHLRSRWTYFDPDGQRVGECEQWFQRPDRFREEGTTAWGEAEGAPARVKVVNGARVWLWAPSARLLFVRERTPSEVGLNLGPLGEAQGGPPLEDRLRTALEQSGREKSDVKIEKLPAERRLGRECDVVEVRYLETHPRAPQRQRRRERYWFDRETHILLRQETHLESGGGYFSGLTSRYEVLWFDQQPPETRLFMPPKDPELRLVGLVPLADADWDFWRFWKLYARLEPHWFEAATAGPEARLQAALAEQCSALNWHLHSSGQGEFQTKQVFYPTELPEGYEFLGSDWGFDRDRDLYEVRALFLGHDGHTLDTLTLVQSPATRRETPLGQAVTVRGLPARYDEEPGPPRRRWVKWEEDGNWLTLQASGLPREELLKLAEAVHSRPLAEIQRYPEPPQVTALDSFPEAAERVPFPLFAPTWWPDDFAVRRQLQISVHRLLPGLEGTPRVTLTLDRTFDADGKPISRLEGEWGEILFEQWPGPAVPRPPARVPTEAVTIHGQPGWFYEEKPFPHRLARFVFWAEGETALALHSNRLTREQLLKLAESVKPVDEAGEAAPAMDPRIARRLQAAIDALAARDADALYAVSHPQERAELNVMETTLQRLLSEVFKQTGPLRPRGVVDRTSNQLGDVWWTVEWDPTGGPPGATTQPFYSAVEGGVAPNHDWAVKVTTSLYGLCQRALGDERGLEAYVLACRASGVGGILGGEGRLRRVEELEQRLQNREKAEQAARQRAAQDIAAHEAKLKGGRVVEETFDRLGEGWTWLDPRGDCRYSLSDRPGYLRIHVPGRGHDLYPESDYHAPRLWRSVTGDFSTEVTFEADPQVASVPPDYDYQGAGVLVWHDETHFLRFELGPDRGGCVRFEGRRGGPYEFPFHHDTPARRLSFRLERAGDQFRAYFRTDDQTTWQPVGTLSMAVPKTVRLGLTVVVGAPDQPFHADFDRFVLHEAPER